MTKMLATSVPPYEDYPTSDGRPMAETPIHRENITDTIEMLDLRYAADPLVYVSGNMFIYYAKGDRLKHVSPDVFMVRGIPKTKQRDAYFVWEEDDKTPDLIIEITSRSTRDEDFVHKFDLYRGTLKVLEYFLFDARAEYLNPPLQGYHLTRGRYAAIKETEGRLPSKVLGLQIGHEGERLRLYDPDARRWLPIPRLERATQQKAELEVERLRRELAELRRSRPKPR